MISIEEIYEDYWKYREAIREALLNKYEPDLIPRSSEDQSDESGEDPFNPGEDPIPSDGESSSSDDEIIIVEDPIISCFGNTVYIICHTSNASIYYRLSQSDDWTAYSTPIEISENTYIESYASLLGSSSNIVPESYQYVNINSENSESDSDASAEDHDYSQDYLTFKVLTGGNIAWKSNGSGYEKTIQYSINGGNWTSITAASTAVTFAVSAGDVVRLKGENSVYAGSKTAYACFTGSTASVDVEGNIMSLVYGDNFQGNNTLTGSYNFCTLFKSLSIRSAEHLILPATTLTSYCYRAMFSETGLQIAPSLPATTLAQGCYWYMFELCAITKAPELLALTLVKECYGHMFVGCANLNYIKCMATSGFSTTDCLLKWTGKKNAEDKSGVASTGWFIKDVNSTWETGVSGIPAGWSSYNNEIIYDPVINFNNENKITISCSTPGASIYYRLGEIGNYSLYTGLITIDSNTTIETYSTKNSQLSNTISQSCTYVQPTYLFAELKIASGPLYYGTNGYEMKTSWNNDSYNSVYGKNSGSYYFNFIEMGKLFEDNDFTSSSEDIENELNPLSGWRLPTKEDWNSIIGLEREGSVVNGNESKHYAFVGLSNVNYAGQTSVKGLLLFPDGENIVGATLSNLDNLTLNNITETQLNTYLTQGCAFLPCCGCYDETWTGGGTVGNYWCSVEKDQNKSYDLLFTDNTIVSDYNNKANKYCGVYLVKDLSSGLEAPLQASNKSIINWTI